MPYPGLLHPEPLLPQQSTADLYLLRGHPNTVLSQSLWSIWVLVRTRYVWALWASLAGMGFDSKHNFTPPTILLGLLCPWTWGISSQLLQYHTTTAPVLVLSNSMKLWAMPCRATQDRWVMVESSDKMWSTGEGNGKPFSILALRTPWTVWKGKKIWHWKINSPGQ